MRIIYLFVCISLIFTSCYDGYKTSIGTGNDEVTVVVVKGSPREMGYSLGKLMASEIKSGVDVFLNFIHNAGVDNDTLDYIWMLVSPFTEQRFKDELIGIAEGCADAGVNVAIEDLVRAHMIPVISPYSCSGIALWDNATDNGHLYQIRNLDWITDIGAQNFPLIVIYNPDEGTPHANIGFTSFIGSIAGMNANGIALSEIGDSPPNTYPFDGEHFSTMFRRILYDATDLSSALNIFDDTTRISKRYHFVYGDGRNEKRAVKIKAHPPADPITWEDNAPDDPVLDKGLETFVDVVYHAESRDEPAYDHIKDNYGTYDADSVIELSRNVASIGSNVMNVVFDATSLELWVSYAENTDEGVDEAYKRDYIHLDMKRFIPVCH